MKLRSVSLPVLTVVPVVEHGDFRVEVLVALLIFISLEDTALLLHRMSSSPVRTGIFTCVVPTASSSAALPHIIGVYT